MCSDNQPLLPRRWDSLYDTEAGCDVVFIVGVEKERVPGHREVLSAANPVFKAMLQGPLTTTTPIPVEDVDPRAFNQLLRFLYGKKVTMQSVVTALNTFSVAHMYMCDSLADLCVSFLDASINTVTVLEIFNFMRPYAFRSYAPSAPPLCNADIASTMPRRDVLGLPSCDALLRNTLQFIDNHADDVLSQEDVEELDLDGLEDILNRDSLNVSSELVVFDALNRWCNRECRRRQMELTGDSRRLILKDCIFLVRYLLMTPKEFISGPMKSEILEQPDSACIIGLILKHNTELSKRLEDLLPRLSRRRGTSDVGTVPLSARSGFGKTSPGAAMYNGGKSKKQRKKGSGKKGSGNSAGSSPERESRGSKFVECFVGAITCIFD